MSNNSNYFKEQFLDFIEGEKNFFTHYKKLFLINFLKILKKNYPHTNIEKKDVADIKNFFKALFLEPALKTSNYENLIIITDFLKDNEIDKNIIKKSFLLMINHYIKYIFPSSNIEKLKKMINLIDFYSNFIDSHFEENYFNSNLPKEIIKFYKLKKNLYVFGVYKGVPISHNSKIISINKKENSIKIIANNYQIIATKFQKDIYLLEPNSKTTLKAYVSEINPYQKILTLTNIQKINRSIAKRNYIRVQPKENIKALINYKKKTFTAEIYDISIKGISVINEKIPIDIDDNVLINFDLSTKKEVFSFNFLCELRSISKYSDNLLRYHFYFEPTLKEEKELEKYIKYREKEIVKELIFYLNKEFIELS